jgi:hypothetical protein
MKKTIIVLAFALLGIGAYAQVHTPSTSTKAEVHQVVGLTDVKVDYSRPNMRGRQVYGDLVPYGRLWRTGANMNTVVTFGNDVEIDGKKTKKRILFAFYNSKSRRVGSNFLLRCQ